jgi:hypothetical protein
LEFGLINITGRRRDSLKKSYYCFLLIEQYQRTDAAIPNAAAGTNGETGDSVAGISVGTFVVGFIVGRVVCRTGAVVWTVVTTAGVVVTVFSVDSFTLSM